MYWIIFKIHYIVGLSHHRDEVIFDVKAPFFVIISNSFTNPYSSCQEIDENRIFDRFYTGDQTRKNRSGIGLSIVKLLVEQMGGHVGAQIISHQLCVNVSFVTMPVHK